MRYGIGLDLAAKQDRCSGIAVIDSYYGEVVSAGCLRTDNEIISFVSDLKPSVIAIDAPLTNKPEIREVDKLMIKLGFRVFPPSFKWMRQLSLRGYELMTKLNTPEFTIIETHPKSVLKHVGLKNFKELLDLIGVKLGELQVTNKHVEDALIASAVAYCYILGRVSKVSSHDGVIYLVEKM
jgi:predicted nuclease with RNAse H fold